MGRLIEVIHSRLAKAAERIEGLISKIRVLLDYPSDQWSQYWQLKRSQVRGKAKVPSGGSVDRTRLPRSRSMELLHCPVEPAPRAAAEGVAHTVRVTGKPRCSKT